MPTATSSYFLAPSWLGRDAGQELRFEDAATGESLAVAGGLRDALLAGHPNAAADVRALASVEPGLAELARSLDAGPLVPLTRGALLRGAGYRMLFVELTATCNERCQHCYASSGPHRTEALSLQTIDAVLTDARALGFTVVQLTGGDPLVSPVCAEAAERALALGFETVELYTNGLALEGALADRLLALPLAWSFSVYSHDAATHDAITRVEGSLARTLEALRRVLAAGRRARAGVVVLDTNAGHSEQTVAMLEKLGLAPDAIGVDVQRQVGRGRFTQDRSALPARPLGESHVAQGRQLFEGRAAVSADGTVFPCIFSRSLPLGSVHQRRLAQLLSDDTPLALPEGGLDGASAWTNQLSCWECRLRAVVLDGRPTPTTGAP